MEDIVIKNNIILPREDIEIAFNNQYDGDDGYIELIGNECLSAKEFDIKYAYAKYIANKFGIIIDINKEHSYNASYLPREKKIVLKNYCESIILHELSHLIHHKTIEDLSRIESKVREIVAEICAYIITKKNNNCCPAANINYILNWSHDCDSTIPWNTKLQKAKEIIYDNQDKILKIVNVILDAQKEVGYKCA